MEIELDTLVFFQVPDVSRILQDLAFWDIYYEHCSYFSLLSLANLFRSHGFEVLDLKKDYGDQYLLITARPSRETSPEFDPAQNLETLTNEVKYFSSNYYQKLREWQTMVAELTQHGQKAVIWGASSKGVAFLNTLHLQDEILYAVDINPHKHGSYVAGTGQMIVGPEFLKEYQPDNIILMNAIYHDEVQRQLTELGVPAKLISV